MRQKVADEIVSTESSYVKGLGVLMEVFVNPLKKDGGMDLVLLCGGVLCLCHPPLLRFSI